MLRPSDCSLADILEADLAVNILSLTQVYLAILCHVTYILDTLQDDCEHSMGVQSMMDDCG